MTLPCERKNALLNAKTFLLSLLDPKKTPRVPLSVRRQAKIILKHYPWDHDIEKLAKKCPDILGDKTLKNHK